MINFKQTMLDVEYIRHAVGPNNEVLIWTMVIGTSPNGFRFQEDCDYGKDPEKDAQCQAKYEFIEDKIEGWIREYCSQFEIAYGRKPDGFPYGNTRALLMMQYESNMFGAPPKGGSFMPSAPSSDENTDKPGRWGIMSYNARCTYMYKCFGRLEDPVTGILMEDHTVCHMMEIAVMKLFNHGRRAEIDWGLGEGLQRASSVLHGNDHEPLLSSSNGKYCPIYRIGYELSDLLEAHLEAWDSLIEPDEGTPKDTQWYNKHITGKHEIYRVIGKARRMLDLLLESISDDICYRRSDSLENTYREVRDSVDHVSRQDRKLLERPDDVNNLHIWRSIRDSKQGDLADNQSNAIASMMANLCTKEAKNYPGSPVAIIMDKAKECKGHQHGDGFKMDSKKLQTAWKMSYQLSQLRWIEQLKRGMYNPQEW